MTGIGPSIEEVEVKMTFVHFATLGEIVWSKERQSW
jgi:hypothetical protein